ncbi:3-oxoacyl-ACP synthase (plasmid) [Streptomyces clavuligerus]|uniref:3-oxoacyl-acp synthase III n=1 Tax=Streptomyces clavuligerus TaxID=1901 RepID=B5GM98_STRCL|nr:3-oxoacyl-ACP synthase [Streptomyces clavuligerus]EDY47444.1 hypothetical protein SSCG_00472 [Streptomyces clavuligerus]EFG04406.1 3-oxoacyl-acp synthase III [Streptomyces clavuligerus]QCS10294.1 3-oxoacyl-ACP synthase [Streptomyces clavuligerus]QPJ97663.1 3-oxoacyl-ACP synthase [Streptomyces clavuligerus]
MPLALDAGWTAGRVRPGDTALLLAIEAGRHVYAGLTLTWDAPAAPTAARGSPVAPVGRPRRGAEEADRGGQNSMIVEPSR